MNKNEKTILNTGAILGDKWVILEFIAKGGMGEVYRAHQKNLNRDVAIKVISKQLMASIGDDDGEMESVMQRFRREVQALAGINHPNVMQIYDYGLESLKSGADQDEINYIAMEYIPGDTLRETMSDQGFDPDDDLLREWIEKYFLAVLDGAEAIHKNDVVHRDLKPENILIDGTIPKIADFGLSKSTRWRAVTQSIDIKGTIMYMPPEQLLDLRRTDHRADIYSLGKILYEAIVGKIGSNDKPTHLKCVGLENPESTLYRQMDAVIRQATAENKEDRFQTIEELKHAVLNALALSKAPFSDKEPSKLPAHTKWTWAGVMAAVLSVLLMTLWHLLGNPGQSADRDGREPLINARSSNAAVPERTYLKKPITTRDNATLHYVPGGPLRLPDDRTVMVKPFYMDETSITNLQYVSFLNQVRSRVQVKNNVVTGDGNIWLMLGDVTEGYEPIIYAGGEFAVKHPGHAACPVLRVTAFGASAYARYYNKRLPTDIEWIYAYQGAGQLPDYPAAMCEQKPIPTPVILLNTNILGIRGLNQCIDEWTLRHSFPLDFQQPDGEKLYTVIGNILNSEKDTPGYSVVGRQPWESFEEVGFRCVKDVSEIAGKSPEPGSDSGEKGY